MNAPPLERVLHHVRHLTAEAETVPDEDLLHRFVTARDEAAFTTLMQRHGPTVLGVCRRHLNATDAEDVFQATFLILVHQASSIRRGSALGCWLYGVAYRLALKARASAVRRQVHEQRAGQMRAESHEESSWDDLRPVLDEELARMPETARTLLVLCDLQGRTHAEAARVLRRPVGSLSRLLAQAREQLRERLQRRGVTLSTAGLTLLLGDHAAVAVTSTLFRQSLRASMAVAAGQSLDCLVSTTVANLVHQGIRELTTPLTRWMAAIVLLVGLLGVTASATLQGKKPEQPPVPVAEQSDPRMAQEFRETLPTGALARLGSVRFRHGHSIRGLAFVPDGNLLVTAGHDHVCRLWEMPTGRLLGTFGDQTDRDNPFAPTRWMCALAVSPDGKLVATGDHVEGWSLGLIRIWDRATHKEVHRFQDAGNNVGTLAVAFTEGSKSLMALSADGTLRLWKIGEAAPVARTALLAEGAAKADFAPTISLDAQRIAAGSNEGPIAVWDATGKRLQTLHGPKGRTLAVGFLPDGKSLVTGSDDGMVRFWDLANGREIRRFEAGTPVLSVGVAPHGRTLATATRDTVILWDLPTGKETKRLSATREDLRNLVFSPDGHILAASAPQSNALLVWDVTTGKNLDPRQGHRGGGFIGRVFTTPRGEEVLTAGADGTVRRWDSLTGELRGILETKHASNRAVALSPDGKYVAIGGWDGMVRLLVRATGQEERRWRAHPERVVALSYRPDGAMIASTGAEGAVVFVSTATGTVQKKLPASSAAGRDRQMAYSPDGRLLALSERGQPLQLINGNAGDAIHTLAPVGEGKLISARGFAFSPDGTVIAAGDETGSVHLWETSSGRFLRSFSGHQGWVMSVAFSPDGRMLAAGNWRSVRLWEIATGKERGRLTGHEGDVAALTFLLEGRRLASAASDTTGLIWDLTGRLSAGQLRQGELTPPEVENTWLEFVGDDAAKAYRAMWTLAAAPKQSLLPLRKVLQPIPPVDPEKLRRLIADLDADEFATREKASAELGKLGEQVEGPLTRAAAAENASPEFRQRVAVLRESWNSREHSQESLQRTRAMELLEAIGDDEARSLLDSLARGAPGSRLTREAKEAIKRLENWPQMNTDKHR